MASDLVCLRCSERASNPPPVPCPYCGFSVGYVSTEDAATMFALQEIAQKNPEQLEKMVKEAERWQS